MSLANTSDESLAVILHFLDGDDISRLIGAGSKRFSARVRQNTIRFDWTFRRPSYFPFSCLAFPRLTSLAIKSEDTEEYYAHLSLQNRPILPLEPMTSLLSIDFSFSTCSALFAPRTSPAGPPATLTSSFPNLTSLSLRSKSSLPDDWAKHLPDTLLRLVLDIPVLMSLQDLPKGLQELEFEADGYDMDFAAELPNLRALRLFCLVTLSFLDTLPNTLEELRVKLIDIDEVELETPFPFSKLPPKLRILSIDAPAISIDWDSMAPYTLEEFYFKVEEGDMDPESLLENIYTKNLRKLHLSASLHPEQLKSLSNVEEFCPDHEFTDLAALELLPRKLRSLTLHNVTMHPKTLEHLPPSLETLCIQKLLAPYLYTLPKSLTKLSVQNIATEIPSPTEWSALPPLLASLTLEAELFHSEECFQFLPGSLKEIEMKFRNKAETDMLERAKFPQTLQNALHTLNLVKSTRRSSDKHPLVLKGFFPKLSEFTCLHTIFINFTVVLNNYSFSTLPKTLTSLRLTKVELEESPEQNGDWIDGPLSRLPEGLVRLSLQFMADTPDSIDFRIFSRLPKRLAWLYLHTGCSFTSDPQKFVDSLPRRLDFFKYKYLKPFHRDPGINKQISRLKDLLLEAIAAYYADPFWDGDIQKRDYLADECFDL